MKKIVFDLDRFTIDPNDTNDTEYSYYVKQTAKLINRSYIQTHKLVEDWALHKIIRRLKEAKKAKNPSMYWWGMRKKDKNMEI